MKPGLYNMKEADYHGDPCPVPSLSAGGCEVLLNQSPLHAYFEHPRLDGNKRVKFSKGMDVGTIGHGLLLEGIDKMEALDFPDWRTNASKDAREDARDMGKIPLLTKDAAHIAGMVQAAKRGWAENENLSQYPQEAGTAEHALIWCEDDGYGNTTWFRCKPDWLSDNRLGCVDPKFTEGSARPEDFERQILRMGYDTRAAFYLRGIKAVFGVEATYWFLLTEQKAPHAASVIALAPSYLALGHEKVAVAIGIWQQCMRTGKWPGYGKRTYYAEAPTYAQTQFMEREFNMDIELGMQA